MRTVAQALVMMALLCNVTYARDQRAKELAQHNKALDKIQAALMAKFRPAIVSVTRNLREPSLVVEIDDSAMPPPAHPGKHALHIAAKAEAAQPQPFLNPNLPSPAQSTADRIKDTLNHTVAGSGDWINRAPSGPSPNRPDLPSLNQGNQGNRGMSGNASGTHVIITPPIHWGH